MRLAFLSFPSFYALALAATTLALVGCSRIPGRPGPGPEVSRPEEVLDFPTLYKANCAACHGQKGEGLASFPRLAWQHQDYLVKQLQVFRETEGRPGTPMKQVTHLLDNKEMKAVAGYLQAFPSDK